MRTFLLSLTTLMISGFLATALATSFAEPQDREVKSANGKYSLKIEAESGKHRIYEGEKLLWSFEREIWHDEYFVSNDGKHVLWVAWKFVREDQVKRDVAVKVYGAKGVEMSQTYDQVSQPRPYAEGEVGPIGDFWRIWRGECKQEGDVVTIQTAGKPACVVDFAKLAQ